MRIAPGRRPWQIHLFAAVLMICGVYALHLGIVAADVTLSHIKATWPSVGWTRDVIIVIQSALFTIVLIPVIAIWAYASRIARILLVVMSVPKLLHLIAMVCSALEFGQVFNPFPILSAVLQLVAVGLLFTPSAAHWFARKEEVDPDVFV